MPRPEQMVAGARYRPLQGNLESRKVAKLRLNPPARWILQHAGAGLERGQITEGFYGIERFYCGGYIDPCLSPKEVRNRRVKYRRAQPAITRTLKLLEVLGLVELVRRQTYVKAVRLTAKGVHLAKELNNATQVAAATIDMNRADSGLPPHVSP